MSSPVLILGDGMAMLYRAFYAIPELSTAGGKPTNAVFGFIRMLRQLADLWKPTHWCVVFDGGLPAHRLELLKDYKAQRKPMPDALRSQVKDVEAYLDCAGIPWVREDRQEADDVLAAVAVRAAGQGASVLIATGDKDMFQLVNEAVRIIPPAGKHADAAMGAEQVKEKTGVRPDQIPDWLALTGDSSDNIPGVPGIGAKTAAKLLGKYGTVKSLLEHVDQVESVRTREALKASHDLVLRNMKMVRLRTDVGAGLDWAMWPVRPPEPGKLIPFLEAMEFHSMARELAEPMLF